MSLRLRLAAAFLAVALSVGARAVAAEPDPQPVIDAERSFAHDAGEIGVVAAFRAHMAPDGLLFRPDPTNGAEWLAQQTPSPPRPGGLTWWPVYAGIARSGDLGFTTGPWTSGTRGGYYLTIWRRQPDGSWRVALDHGPELTPSPLSRNAPVALLPQAETPPVQARDGRLADVFARDDGLAAAARTDAAGAFAAVLSADARLMGGAGAGQPAVGKPAWQAELGRRARTIEFSRLGGDISEAGDFAYTYGRARWTGPDGAAAEGHYVRLWQQRARHWVLFLDEIVEGPPSTPPAPPKP